MKKEKSDDLIEFSDEIPYVQSSTQMNPTLNYTFTVASPRRRQTADEQRTKVQVNQSMNIKNVCVVDSEVNTFKHEDSIRKNKHWWMLPSV